GWITLFITGALVVLMFVIKRSYEATDRQVAKMAALVDEVESSQPFRDIPVHASAPFDPRSKTAVVLVKDFSAVGIKTILHIFPSFLAEFKNFVFVQVGLIDAGAFKGTEELDRVKRKVEDELGRYVHLMRRHGYHAEGVTLFGIDTAEELEKYIPRLLERYPNCVFFGGQIMFPRWAFLSRLLHNYTLFAVQRQLYDKMGINLYVLPVELTPTV
ncbi:MAG TPA: hypothetical protein VMT55_02215, partial [Candidatus Sulfotelmatobacter sp.]|nr:hypothetical protein [Candidatus Sulfotelmatobacter sp.]